MSARVVFVVVLTTLLALGCKSQEAKPAATAPARPTAEECRKAYEHVAELEAAQGKASKEMLMSTYKGAIEQCEKHGKRARVDCLGALTDVSMQKIMDCESLR